MIATEIKSIISPIFNRIAMNATQSSDVRLHHQHYTNLLAHLARRMESAQQHNDSRLLALLEVEQRQLAAEWSTRSTKGAIAPSLNLIQRFWQWLLVAIEDSSKLQVEKLSGTNGDTWWYAYDPGTGKALYAESESDVVKWIEDNRIGH